MDAFLAADTARDVPVGQEEQFVNGFDPDKLNRAGASTGQRVRLARAVRGCPRQMLTPTPAPTSVHPAEGGDPVVDGGGGPSSGAPGSHPVSPVREVDAGRPPGKCGGPSVTSPRTAAALDEHTQGFVQTGAGLDSGGGTRGERTVPGVDPFVLSAVTYNRAGLLIHDKKNENGRILV
eukprot:CAMPEP_0113324318 /NCGR_PEP_ID=MMETSP0010_2-20120614/16958_1 /TAXON_ID=216773 ORGANISM="Corethron hystrix, Strain 308" /NCGR_SAMPLE_ID=MMETSP0010_2 /ASSEMBLY_ACC=CAM_ASM_000155 /LENGTH=177 /DNA_ID=CAMNT_0000183643 /DNA_START=68 /DNA_END=603 /DNA_ORIENTATION=+ /assembly_acc=CAM_ASM_000155